MTDVIVVPETESKPEPENRTEDKDEWKILLGELKAKLEALETDKTEQWEKLRQLESAEADHATALENLWEETRREREELYRRLAELEAMEITEELETEAESTPEAEAEIVEVPPDESVEENQEPERKRPRLIV